LLKKVACDLHDFMCPRMTRIHTNPSVVFDSRLLV
jgi:hypothetical protein